MDALDVIESGAERDARGRSSGTFAAARIALELEIPVLVVDPFVFDAPPAGNKAFIKGGATELDPDGAIAQILAAIAASPEAPGGDGSARQGELFS